ncbi:hypothetical protein Tco_1353745 [Tanacetum coccineum]
MILKPEAPDDDHFNNQEYSKDTLKADLYETNSMLLLSELLDSILLTWLQKIIVEPEVKRSVTSSLNSCSQNLAFLSGHRSTNDVNTANVHVSTGSTPRTGKKIIINGSDTAGYDKKKVECFNGHKLRHFARECRNPRSQENRNKSQDSSRRTVNVEESSSKAMLAIDGTGFDWSYMADEEASTNFALMAFSDSEGLASVEEQLVFYKKNESMLCDQIDVLKRYASFNESDINALKKQVERLKKEKEDNQFKIDNFENASKSLDQLIGNQISDNNKKGLGYNVVPPPLTGLFAPPSIDLSNSGLEKFKQPEFEGYGVKVNKGASENVSKEVKKTSDAPIIEDWVSDCDEDETVVLESLNVQKPKQADQPRKVSQNPRNNSTSWNTPMPKKLGVGFQFTPKACFVCGSFNHLIKDCDFHDKRMVQKPVLNNVKKGTGQREIRPVWTNAMRVNHQKFSNSRRNFAPTAVLTKSGLVPFSTARQSFSRTTAPVSATRSFKTAAPKPSVNVEKQKTNDFQKSHSPLRRPFYQQTAFKNRNLNNKFNIVKENSVNTVKGKRMTSVVGEQGINAVKPTAYWAETRQTTTGKETSNLFMAGSLPKNYKSNDPPLSKGYTLENGKDSPKLIALMDLCTKLFDKKVQITILAAEDCLISEDPVKQERMKTEKAGMEEINF